MVLIVVLLLTLLGHPALGQQQCIGACNDPTRVTVTDLVLCININLERRPLDDCTACDGDANGRVDIYDLVGAVNNSLDSCPTGANGAPSKSGPIATNGDVVVNVN